MCFNILLQIWLGKHLKELYKTMNENVICITGVTLETSQKGWKSSVRVAIVYFSSVLSGSLLTTLICPDTANQGASCGVYGLLGATLGNQAYSLSINTQLQPRNQFCIRHKFNSQYAPMFEWLYLRCS